MPWTIRLLGPPTIVDPEGRTRDIRGHQAWAVLARLLIARAPLDRGAMAGELFPDTIDPLGSLRWTLAALRKALDSSDCLRGDPIDLNLPVDCDIDVWRLDDDGFDIAEAGPLLQGVEPRASSEFATWLLIERQRIAALIDARIRRDAIMALSAGDYDRAIQLAEWGARRNPLDEGAHVLLVRSLALNGKHEIALRHVEATEKQFLAELGEKPSAALRSAARKTVASAPGGVAPSAFANALILSGLAALSAGAADAGLDCLRRAVSESETSGDRELLARALHELGCALVHAVRGYDDEGSIWLRQSADLAREAGYARVAAASFRELGYVEALAGRRPSAERYLKEAIAFACEPEARAGVRAVAAFNLVDWGRPAEGVAMFRESLEDARLAGAKRREIWSLGIGARGLLALDQDKEARSWLTLCLKLAEEQGWMAFRPWPLALLGECGLREARDPAGLRPELEVAFALSCQLGDPCWEGAAARTLSKTFVAAGDLRAADGWLREAHDRSLRETDSYAALLVDILADRAALSRRMGQAEEAIGFARHWVAMAAKTNMDDQIARAASFIAASRFP